MRTLLGTALGVLSVSIGLLASSPSGAQDAGAEEGSRARTIVVGVRADAKPFSYRGHTDAGEKVLAGYRGYMVEICRRVLREVVASGPFRGFAVEGRVVSANDRFEALGGREANDRRGRIDEDETVDLLCGPDSVTTSRLRAHAVSQPMFVSGLTYAYVDPTSGLFPRGPYCGGVVGVLRGTTAMSVGLRRLADENVLLRFDEALESYLAASPKREGDVRRAVARAFREHAAELGRRHEEWRGRRLAELRDIVGLELAERVDRIFTTYESDRAEAPEALRARRLEAIGEVLREGAAPGLAERAERITALLAGAEGARSGGAWREDRRADIDAVIGGLSTDAFEDEDDAAERIALLLDVFLAREAEDAERAARVDAVVGAESAVDSPFRKASRVVEVLTRHAGERARYRRELFGERDRAIEARIAESRGALAKTIRTAECPDGFESPPVRSYTSHDDGIPELCEGKVLYYVGDYDIIARKVAARSDCPVIIERFTRTKEVYAAFFRAAHLHGSLDDSCEPDGTASACGTSRRDAMLYAAFNHTLLRLMQPHVDILSFEFEREFGARAKSADLETFFESFRIVSDY